MSKCKHFFKACGYRQKVAFLCVLATVAGFWTKGCVERATTLHKRLKVIERKSQTYRSQLSHNTHSDAEVQNALGLLDASKTLSSTAFTGEVENLVRRYKLSYTMTPPQSRKGDIFDMHVINLHCEKVKIKDLILLEKDLANKKPYIYIEKVFMQPNAFNMEDLEVDYTLISLWLNNKGIANKP